MILFSILCFVGKFSIISIIFFIWNFYNRKAFLGASITFFAIAILLNIYYFTFAKPVSEKLLKEWNTVGYDEKYKGVSQEFLNVLAREIEDYKHEKGAYPYNLDDLKETKKKMILNFDMSYRVKLNDGRITGISYFYERIDTNKFYLAAVGKDGIGKTDDDIVPEIFHYEEKNTGLIKYKLKPFTTKDMIESLKKLSKH